MAKYTLLFKEYMDVGELPTSIDKIEMLLPGFKDAFIARNLYKEIGAETLELFKNRLDAVALRIYPKLKAQIDVRDAGINGRNRKDTETRNLATYGTFDKGEINTVNRNLAHAPINTPLNNEDVTDGSSQNVNSGQDVTHATDTGTIVREYEEQNIDTSISWAEFNERFNNLFSETLRAFDCCFLGVW